MDHPTKRVESTTPEEAKDVDSTGCTQLLANLLQFLVRAHKGVRPQKSSVAFDMSILSVPTTLLHLHSEMGSSGLGGGRHFLEILPQLSSLDQAAMSYAMSLYTI